MVIFIIKKCHKKIKEFITKEYNLPRFNVNKKKRFDESYEHLYYIEVSKQSLCFLSDIFHPIYHSVSLYSMIPLFLVIHVITMKFKL